MAAEHARFGVPNGGLLSHVRCSSWGTSLHAVQSQMQEPSATQQAQLLVDLQPGDLLCTVCWLQA